MVVKGDLLINNPQIFNSKIEISQITLPIQNILVEVKKS